MAIRAGVVHGPTGSAVGPVRIGRAVIAESNRRIHEPREHPLRRLPIIRRERKLFVFKAWKLPEWLLNRTERAQDRQAEQEAAHSTRLCRRVHQCPIDASSPDCVAPTLLRPSTLR